MIDTGKYNTVVPNKQKGLSAVLLLAKTLMILNAHYIIQAIYI